jgi:hypothetical protein
MPAKGKTDRPVITRTMADKAAVTLDAAVDGTVSHTQMVAATKMLMHWQTQEKYTPEQREAMLRKNHPSEAVRNLDALDDDELNRLTAQLLAAESTTAA